MPETVATPDPHADTASQMRGSQRPNADPQAGNPWRDLIDAMDQLFSPGGCPWDAEQTHESLVKYLLEESHELVDAIETGDRAGIREELGDVLLQVVFHARIAAEHAEDPFDADDVARDLLAKLIRRHPHVFAGQEIDGDLFTQWDAIKRAEKQRTSILDGIPATLGALAHAQKILGRVARAGIELPQTDVVRETAPTGANQEEDPGAAQVRGEQTGADAQVGENEDAIGAELLAIVRRAAAAGIDAEGALRTATRTVIAQVRALEQRTPATTWADSPPMTGNRHGKMDAHHRASESIDD